MKEAAGQKTTQVENQGLRKAWSGGECSQALIFLFVAEQMMQTPSS